MKAGATGAAGVGSDSGHAVGLLGGQEERELPVTLPEVVEDEEQEDDSDPYSTWHALYGTDALVKCLEHICFTFRMKREHVVETALYLSLLNES